MVTDSCLNVFSIDQFLNDGTNQRIDSYGGSMENRCRLLFEVVEALGTVYSFGRIGVRISPHEVCSTIAQNSRRGTQNIGFCDSVHVTHTEPCANAASLWRSPNDTLCIRNQARRFRTHYICDVGSIIASAVAHTLAARCCAAPSNQFQSLPCPQWRQTRHIGLASA